MIEKELKICGKWSLLALSQDVYQDSASNIEEQAPNKPIFPQIRAIDSQKQLLKALEMEAKQTSLEGELKPGACKKDVHSLFSCSAQKEITAAVLAIG